MLQKVNARQEGLYIHIPFCHSKCFYCDFYSRPCRESGEFDSFVQALITEYNLRIREFESSGKWNTIYIGGGTPSMLPFPCLEKIVRTVAREADPVEFTIEANPEDISEEWVRNIGRLGINRISMGVQSFADKKLISVGRRHNSAMAINAIGILADSGMDYNLDLIYGLPEQSAADWETDLRRLLHYRPPHFSAYLLSYEPGTRLYQKLMKGTVVETSEETAQEMYAILCDLSGSEGYDHYEISNFALPAKRAIHNSNYWKGYPYLGIGPGAHSHDGTRRGYNPSDLKRYVSLLASGQLPFLIEEETPSEQLNDILITTLRVAEGIDLDQIRGFDRSLISRLRASLEKLAAGGLIIRESPSRYRIPETAWLRSDSIFRSLIIV